MLFLACSPIAAGNSGNRLPQSDCAQPIRASFSKQLAEDADVVISGLAVSISSGAPQCVPAGADSPSNSGSPGPDLLVKDDSAPAQNGRKVGFQGAWLAACLE